MAFELKNIRNRPLLWMLIFVPLVLAVEKIAPSAHTALFILATLAIIPLAALLGEATEVYCGTDRRRSWRTPQCDVGKSNRTHYRHSRTSGRRIYAGQSFDCGRNRDQLALHAGRFI